MKNNNKLIIAGLTNAAYFLDKIEKYFKKNQLKPSLKPTILKNIDFRFNDTENCVRLHKHVGGGEVFLIQNFLNPNQNQITINENYLSFLIAARAFKEHGASSVTGILPYLAYMRQDKPTPFKREPTTARLMADLSLSAGMDRLITWHPHSPQIHGFYGKMPLNFLSPLNGFISYFKKYKNNKEVIAVAPDRGASELVNIFAKKLGIKSGIGIKFRDASGVIELPEIIGDFENKKTALILDDIVSTGSSITALTKKLVKEKKIQKVIIAASHFLNNKKAVQNFNYLHEKYNLHKVITTDSIKPGREFLDLPYMELLTITDQLALVIKKIYTRESISNEFIKE